VEGTGFELPVRGRGEAGCRPFAAPVCLGRVGSRQSDPATAIAERVSFGWVPDKIGWQKGAPTRPKLAGATTRFIALAYWKFESSPLQQRVCKLSIPLALLRITSRRHASRKASAAAPTTTSWRRRFAESGIFVASIDFRMPPVAPHPGSIQDINLGIRWLKANAREFKIR
jgi:hypothetical protein